MRPDDRELDDEIRGHIALSVKERIERGEDPVQARIAAYREFGYVPAIRDSMRGVWYSRWFDAGAALLHDIRIGLRSLRRAKGLAATIVVTLALGIGANAAIFSVVREVLLRPLANRDADRLIYIRQSAAGLGDDNLTFSVPEIADFRSRVSTLSAFGEFSTVEFTMVGIGQPRIVRSGVVDGSYFEVMGLRPVLGRLLNASDDGPEAASAAVLTYRFWSTALNRDPSIVGTTITLGTRVATVVGVLEPSLPYPADTEIIANIATSPHHLGATMVTMRTHRMTELFGRLAPGATLDDAKAELQVVHAAMMREHPESYGQAADIRVDAALLRDQLAAPARPVLLLLLAAAAVVFIIACANVASLILARSVRREGELAVRAALGAGPGALRRTLLAESLVLCGAGAVLGLVLAAPAMSLVSRFASRFSVRALDVTMDAGLLGVGAGLAMAAAVLLAFVPRLPSTHAAAGLGLGSGSLRMTAATNRRLRVFATTQIAFSFVLLAGAAALVAALLRLQAVETGYDTRHVLAFDVPSASTGALRAEDLLLLESTAERVRQLPGVSGAAAGSFVPWRDAGRFGAGVSFAAEGYTPENGEEEPRARLRIVSPGFFDTLGVAVIAGRDFGAQDRRDSEPVVIVSESLAARLFPGGHALGRRMWWTDPYFGQKLPRRIVGIVADVDDESMVPRPAMAVYHPVRQMPVAGRLFVRTAGDPYAVVPAVRRIIQDLSPRQPVERPATLEDVRAEMLASDRINAFVFSGFAGIALLIAVVGVSGVLAFSVSARTREIGVRLAMGASPRRLLMGVVADAALIVAAGIGAGAAVGYVLTTTAGVYVGALRLPSAAAASGAAAALAGAALLASLLPAVRAARVNVLLALRSE